MKRLIAILLFALPVPAQQANFPPGGGGTGSTTNPAAPIMALYFTNACPTSNTGQCWYTPANTQTANDCTWSNAGTTLTCATSHFAATDVGKRVAGYLMNGVPSNIFGCVIGRTSFSSMTTGTLTISGFTSGTQITLSGTPSNTATSNQGCFVWGTPDDTTATAFEAYYDALVGFCPKVMLAAANYWFSSPHFSSQPNGCANLGTLEGATATYGNMVYTAGFELEGRGPGNTVINLGPDFPNGDTCTRSIGNITNACFLVPLEGKWSDFQISGVGQSTCQVTAGRNLIGVTVGTMQNITLSNMCWRTNGMIGIKADLLAQLYQVNSSGWGTHCFQTTTAGSYVQAFKLACENSGGEAIASGSSVDVLAGGAGIQFQCWGCLLLGGLASTNQNVVQVASGANARFNGTIIANCEAGSNCSTTATALVKNSGTIYLTDVVGIAQGGASLVGGINCALSGATVYMERSSMANIGNANYGDVAGCNLVDLGGNSALFTGTSSLAGNVIADGRQTEFSCTGTANASATNSLYGTGPNVTSTTCAGQTSTLGAGIPFPQARTIAGIICTSSATTVSVACTVMVNGSPTSTTCTMTAATRCSNLTTTAVNPADLLSARIVTGAAETGANIKMQVIWQ